MQYAIPEIIVDPPLTVCQKSICDIAYSIIGCEKQISGKKLFF